MSPEIGGKREVCLYTVDKETSVGNFQLAKGNAVAVTREKHIQVRADANSEIILFDVPLNE